MSMNLRDIEMTDAVAYYRTSSAANVGSDKDSDKRQRQAIAAYAKAHGYKITSEYYDAAVSGADPIETRPGFAELLDKIEGNGVRTVIVEGIDRLARDVGAGVIGLMALKARGVTVLDTSGNDLTNPADEMQKAFMQIGLVFAELEKTRLVNKLKVARERKRAATGKCEGRKSLNDKRPDMVRQAKRLARRNPATGKTRSLRTISSELAALGFTRDDGSPYSAMTIRNVINR